MDEDSSLILASDKSYPDDHSTTEDPFLEIEKTLKPKECCPSSIVISEHPPHSSRQGILQFMEYSQSRMNEISKTNPAKNDGAENKIEHEMHYSMELTINLSKAIINVNASDEVSEEISITQDIKSSRVFPSEVSPSNHEIKDRKSPGGLFEKRPQSDGPQSKIEKDQTPQKLTQKQDEQYNEIQSSIQKQPGLHDHKREEDTGRRNQQFPHKEAKHHELNEKDNDGCVSQMSRDPHEQDEQQKRKELDKDGNSVNHVSRELHDPAVERKLKKKDIGGSVSQFSCDQNPSEEYPQDDYAERIDDNITEYSKTLGTSEKEISEENPYDLYFSNEKMQEKCRELNRTASPCITDESESRALNPYLGANLDMESKPVAFLSAGRLSNGKSQSVIVGNIRLSAQSRRHRSIQSQDGDSSISDRVNSTERQMDDVSYSSEENACVSDKNLIMSKFGYPKSTAHVDVSDVKRYIEAIITASLKQAQMLREHEPEFSGIYSEISSKNVLHTDRREYLKKKREPKRKIRKDAGAMHSLQLPPKRETSRKRKEKVEMETSIKPIMTQRTNLENLSEIFRQAEEEAEKSKKRDMSKTRSGPKIRSLDKNQISPPYTKLPKKYVDNLTATHSQKTDDIKGSRQRNDVPNAQPVDNEMTKYSTQRIPANFGETQHEIKPNQNISKSSQNSLKQLEKASPYLSDLDKRHYPISKTKQSLQSLGRMKPYQHPSKHFAKSSPEINDTDKRHYPEQLKKEAQPTLRSMKAPQHTPKQLAASSPAINETDKRRMPTPFPINEPIKYTIQPKLKRITSSQFQQTQFEKAGSAISNIDKRRIMPSENKPLQKTLQSKQKHLNPSQFQSKQSAKASPGISGVEKRYPPFSNNVPVKRMLQPKEKRTTSTQLHLKQSVKVRPAISYTEKAYSPFLESEPLWNAFLPGQEGIKSFQFQPKQFAKDSPVIRSIDKRYLFSETEPFKDQVKTSWTSYSSAYLRKIGDEGNYVDTDRYIGLKCHCTLHDGQNTDRPFLRAMCYRHHREILSHRNRINNGSAQHFDKSEVEILCYKHDEEIRNDGPIECHCFLKYGGENVHRVLQNGINLYRLCYNHHKEIAANTPGKSLVSGYRSHEHFYGSGFEILCRQHEEHVIRLCKEHGKGFRGDVAHLMNQFERDNKCEKVYSGMDKRSSDEASFCPGGGENALQQDFQSTNLNLLNEKMKVMSQYDAEFNNPSSEKQKSLKEVDSRISDWLHTETCSETSKHNPFPFL